MTSRNLWIREVADTFVRVLNRPRFGLAVTEKEGHFGCVSFRIDLPTGDSVTLRLLDAGTFVDVRVTRDGGAKFFSEKISRFQSPKIRRIALILAKKISVKSVYDVMFS